MPMKVVTVRRWEVLMVFLVFTVSVIVMGVYLKYDIDRNGNALKSIKHEKASIYSLEVTDCKLKTFLASSARVRTQLAQKETNPKKRKQDFRGVSESLKLAKSFTNELCPK